ncbi:MAG: hypothetical protein LBT22_06895 [Peptococcaceae bacterium]|nr:hypothetical protein [Peptococcaceae bacterium]
MERIAVASTDGRRIDAHFGQAKQFFIYLIGDDGSITEEGARTVEASIGISEGERLSAKAELLADVDYVLSVRIGPAAVAELEKRGTKAYAYSGETEKVLARYVKRRGIIKNLAKTEAAYLESCSGSGGGCGDKGGCSGCGG